MNEITKIHLGQQPYTVSVDAYKALRAYLQAITEHAGDDVAGEVELRMAELLAERGITGDKVILQADVDFLKQQLGDPGDFDDDEAPKTKKHADQADEHTAKRLFRDTDNAMLAGVCAGLATYFGIDAVIVRLLFAALIFFGGSGILLYVVLWLVVPEAKTNSERLQMQGESVTVGSIQKIVNRADVQGATRRARDMVAPFLRGLGRLLLAVLGVLFIVISLVNILAITTVGIYMWSNSGLIVAGEHFFPVGLKDALLLASAAVVGITINLFFLLSGRALIRRKWGVPGWLTGGFIGLIMVGLAAGAALGFDTAPRIHQRFEALYHTQTITVSPYKKVAIHSDKARFIYHPSATYKIEYRYLGKPVSFTQTVKDDTLTLDTSNIGAANCNFACLYGDRDLQVTIFAPTIDDVNITGMSQHAYDTDHYTSFSNSDPWQQTDFTITAARGVNVELQYVNPQAVVFTANPDESTETIQTTGLQPQAFVSDTVGLNNATLVVSRTGTFELHTNAQCLPDMTLAQLLSYPDNVIINGHSYPTKGDLRSAQNDLQRLPANCVQVIGSL